MVSYRKLLRSVISKTFNEIVLAFLPVERQTDMLSVNTFFTGNLLLEFGGYYGKVVPEPRVFHLS